MLDRPLTRRSFLKKSVALSAGLGLAAGPGRAPTDDVLFPISLAQWSLHRTLFGGELDNLDFARVAKQEFGIAAVEYVNQFFMEKATDRAYLAEMKRRAKGEGVQSVLIMCDGEGALGASDKAERLQAVENHHKWVDAAAFLGCHAVRVNARSEGAWEEQQKLAADGLHRLCEYAEGHDIDVLVENHGGLSSNGRWLAGVMEMVGHPRVGTLPDFGNFQIREGKSYNRYKGVRQMMPYAGGVSAKSYAFNAQGRETTIDYERMMGIVLDGGYRGHVGIEYEGDELSEAEGIRATKRLLERVRTELAPEYT